MKKDLSYYIYCFTHLKRDMKNGGAPHKPILILSLIEMFEKQMFYNNQIYILPELVSSFKTHWNELVKTNHHPIFALPFYHLNSEPFWKLIPNLGCEKWIESKSSMRSFNNLTTAVNFTLIDIELKELLEINENRNVLKYAILDKYFPETKMLFGSIIDNSQKIDVLNEPTEIYKQKIIELKNNLNENAFQEEVFVRSGIFKREIPKIYNNTCAISGLRVDAILNVSMIDACHIVPFSEGYNDTLINGFALCPNLHRAFDRGLISISNDYRVLLNNNFVENKDSTLNLNQFKGQLINLPTNNEFHPSLDNFKHHRKRFGFE
jgi:putative restriction endonuclease